jgi:uncharacterized protein YjbI with pentapeptide repeats
MLILVEPHFIVDDEDDFYLNQIGNEPEVDSKIILYLKKVFPMQNIKRLGKTNCYTISTLPTETIDNMVWINGYITKLTAVKNNQVKIMVGAALYSANLKFNVFSKINPEHVSFYDSDINDKLDEFKELGIQLNGFNELQKELNEVALNGMVLIGANFKDSFIQNSSFFKASIPAGDFTNANLLGTTFYDADLRYADFTNAILTKRDEFGYPITANFERANLRYANFANGNLESVVFTEADLSDVNMSKANLNEARLNGIVLNNADLSEAILTRTSINDAELTGIRLIGANLERALVTGSFLNDANLTGANLTDAILTNADLRNSNFTNADLTDADLRHTKLDGTIFTGCNLTRTRFYGSNWQNARFDNGQASLANADLLAGPDDVEEDEEWENQQALAFEIHNAYDKINMDKYMEILNRMVDDSLLNVYKTDIIKFIRTALTERINALFKNKAEMIEMLNAVLDKLSPTDLIKNESIRIQVGKTISYVLTLPPSLQTSYINYLVRGCYFAYPEVPAGEGLSCVKGIPERIIYLIGETLMLIPVENRSKNEKELVIVFGSYLDLDNTDYIQAWVNSWDTRDEEWSKLKADERKLDFIEFVFQKYRENSSDFDDNEENIRKLVNDKANEFNYVFSNMEESNITFGGKRTKKTKKTKITKKSKITKKAKKATGAKKAIGAKKAKKTNKINKKTKNAKKEKKSWKTKNYN